MQVQIHWCKKVDVVSSHLYVNLDPKIIMNKIEIIEYEKKILWFCSFLNLLTPY